MWKCGSIYFARRPPPTPIRPLGCGQNVKINFFKTWSSCISTKMESQMQPHGSKYFPRRPPPPPRGPGGQKVKIKLFQNIVMLHIKGNRECSNMVANADRGTINKKHIKPDF